MMDKLRSEIIEEAKSFSTSWIKLGGKLHTVKYERLYRSWMDENAKKFKSFTEYSRHDLRISSTVASDMATAYRYLVTRHKELIGNRPSDGIPGYNEIVVLLRSKNKIADNDFSRLDEMLFTGQIGRDRLRQEIRTLIPRGDNQIKQLKDEIAFLIMRIEELEAEVKRVRGLGLNDLTVPELHRVKRIVSKSIHPDSGGSNDEMKTFNVFIDKLMALTKEN